MATGHSRLVNVWVRVKIFQFFALMPAPTPPATSLPSVYAFCVPYAASPKNPWPSMRVFIEPTSAASSEGRSRAFLRFAALALPVRRARNLGLDNLDKLAHAFG